MLSVIVDARHAARSLPALLAQLTAGAVEGLVREVLIVAPASELVSKLCEETGAEPYPALDSAIAAARASHLMVLPADLRLRDGWLPSLADHVGRGGAPALVAGISGGLFGRRPYGVLMERACAAGVEGGDLRRLRRRLGLRPARIG